MDRWNDQRIVFLHSVKVPHTWSPYKKCPRIRHMLLFPFLRGSVVWSLSPSTGIVHMFRLWSINLWTPYVGKVTLEDSYPYGWPSILRVCEASWTWIWCRSGSTENTSGRDIGMGCSTNMSSKQLSIPSQHGETSTVGVIVV